jgi:peptidoglycan hydrolase-like protein with peptidoglycan-binding domain
MMKRILTVFLVALSVTAFSLAAHASDINKMPRSKIQSVQQALADGGFYRYGVDGKWGPYSDAALRSFQQSKGLPVTGRLDKETAKRLGVVYSEKGQSPNKKMQ